MSASPPPLLLSRAHTVGRAARLLAIGAFFAAMFALRVKLCPFAIISGHPCPGCGLTRATVALLQGHLAEALRFHPLSIVISPLFCAMFGYNALVYVREGRWAASEGVQGRWVTAGALALTALLVVVWIARFLGAFVAAAPCRYEATRGTVTRYRAPASRRRSMRFSACSRIALVDFRPRREARTRQLPWARAAGAAPGAWIQRGDRHPRRVGALDLLADPIERLVGERALRLGEEPVLLDRGVAPEEGVHELEPRREAHVGGARAEEVHAPRSGAARGPRRPRRAAPRRPSIRAETAA